MIRRNIHIGNDCENVTNIPEYNSIASTERKFPKGPFSPLDQPASFGAGSYIEMVHSCHQPSEYKVHITNSPEGEKGFSAKFGPSQALY